MKPVAMTERATFMAHTDTQRRLLYRACNVAAVVLRQKGGPTAERDAMELEELGREVLGYLSESA